MLHNLQELPGNCAVSRTVAAANTPHRTASTETCSSYKLRCFWTGLCPLRAATAAHPAANAPLQWLPDSRPPAKGKKTHWLDFSTLSMSLCFGHTFKGCTYDKHK